MCYQLDLELLTNKDNIFTKQSVNLSTKLPCHYR